MNNNSKIVDAVLKFMICVFQIVDAVLNYDIYL